MQSKPRLSLFHRSVRSLEQSLSWSLITLMALMTLNVLWQITTRFVFSNPSSYTEELARFLLIWIGLLGGCHAYRVGAHLGLDLLSAKLEKTARRHLHSLISIAVIGMASSILVYGGGQLMLLTYELKQTSAAMQIPMYCVYLVLPLSGLILCIYAVDSLLLGPRACYHDTQS